MRPDPAARRPARPDATRPSTLADGYLQVDTGAGARAGHRRPDDPVPRDGRSLHARRGATAGRDALLERDDGDHEPGRHPAQRRAERRPGGGLHLRPRPLGRLHAPGQPGLGGPEARRPGAARSAPTTCSSDGPPDWVDLNKVAIPQADEQQRLLANLIRQMNARPQAAAALLVLPARREGRRRDDRRRPRQRRTRGPLRRRPGGQPGRLLGRRLGVRALDRPTSTRTRRSATRRPRRTRTHGFEIGLHVNTGCADWTPASRSPATSTTQLADFAAAVPEPRAARRPTAPTASPGATGRRSRRSSSQNGIRLDTNYYYWPPGWVHDRPGSSPARACRCASPTSTAR